MIASEIINFLCRVRYLNGLWHRDGAVRKGVTNESLRKRGSRKLGGRWLRRCFHGFMLQQVKEIAFSTLSCEGKIEVYEELASGEFSRSVGTRCKSCLQIISAEK